MLQEAPTGWSWLPVWLVWQPRQAEVERGTWLSWWTRWRSRRRAPAPEPAESNRRQSYRFDINLDTSCLLIAALENDVSPVRVRNISAGGISLVLSHGVETHTILTVQLLNRPRMFLCTVDVRVTYAVEHPTGDWILGGEFNRKLTVEELRALLAKD